MNEVEMVSIPAWALWVLVPLLLALVVFLVWKVVVFLWGIAG
jgi:hypothetical protein